MGNDITFWLIMSIYLGFAGAWGGLMSASKKLGRVLVVSFGVLLFLPASIGLPWDLLYRVLGWLAALIVIGVFFIQPKWLPGFIWHAGFLYGYFSFVLFMIFYWTVLSEEFRLIFWLGLPALIACGIGMIKSLRLFQALIQKEQKKDRPRSIHIVRRTGRRLT